MIDANEHPVSAPLNPPQHSGTYEPAETIYTANPSFSAPLVLTATFVAAVFALNGADMARTMWSETDKKGETTLAPAWKRYLIASGFATVALGITVWGCTAPARYDFHLDLVTCDTHPS